MPLVFSQFRKPRPLWFPKVTEATRREQAVQESDPSTLGTPRSCRARGHLGAQAGAVGGSQVPSPPRGGVLPAAVARALCPVQTMPRDFSGRRGN